MTGNSSCPRRRGERRRVVRPAGGPAWNWQRSVWEWTKRKEGQCFSFSLSLTLPSSNAATVTMERPLEEHKGKEIWSGLEKQGWDSLSKLISECTCKVENKKIKHVSIVSENDIFYKMLENLIPTWQCLPSSSWRRGWWAATRSWAEWPPRVRAIPLK